MKKYYQDYEVGETRETYGRTITETDVVLHAGQSGDFYPHHMDAEWCKTQEFGQRIAHGTLVFAVTVGLGASEINSVAFTYGYDRIRFIKPVFIGDTLHSRITVIEKRSHPKRSSAGIVVERVEAINQHGVTVFACDHLLMVEKRN
ncbi:MaoC/PaaZ C-terminal domain-containing protein [Alicyclobacillus kakegawensis]|uniref:MaoC/PaaZ C-terminal domain-containing protein n=1 Tax=Alicyclobacillus kakegawensis TaxID=392012 RepID=UPI0008315843|nr:MaoC/PaaZ C-terminal domain-containing protein [Alicyclobacillus kakegawensis]